MFETSSDGTVTPVAAGDFHELPVRDAVAHDPSEDCVCGPTADLKKCDDGVVRLFLHHHALVSPKIV
ncbi:MAG: hypothetical protein AVDCRST_MAG29-278 [uncultured Nocardioidaceae bacterium]|uniref:Uncharacterized protein n=1 Tax=uncultured Nocardioidaceae bacterium TaxID=253824 RepID=A0A6J4KYT1_9ACTN|nr:MAG: hypothetical protein AVDCRST_MAG29-278 [uncultured Nocardioidaceae bacterium]